MRLHHLRTVGVVGLSLCSAVFADTLVGSGGAGWQNWVVADVNGNALPYWDGVSADGTNRNIGNCISGVGSCAMPDAPGVIPYWGIGTAADPAFTFNKTTPGSQAALKIEIAGNSGINTFGWYDTANRDTSNVLFTGPAGAGASATFTPTANYGFWFTGSQGTYFTQSNFNSADNAFQHFAVFSPSAGSGDYWLGMEDLNSAGSDKDYNDMVVRVTASVPDGGMTLMLLGGALVGLETLRRKFRA